MPSLGHGGDAGHNCGTAGEGGEGEGGSGRELAHASRMLGLDPGRRWFLPRPARHSAAMLSALFLQAQCAGNKLHVK